MLQGLVPSDSIAFPAQSGPQTFAKKCPVTAEPNELVMAEILPSDELLGETMMLCKGREYVKVEFGIF